MDDQDRGPKVLNLFDVVPHVGEEPYQPGRDEPPSHGRIARGGVSLGDNDAGWGTTEMMRGLECDARAERVAEHVPASRIGKAANKLFVGDDCVGVQRLGRWFSGAFAESG